MKKVSIIFLIILIFDCKGEQMDKDMKVYPIEKKINIEKIQNINFEGFEYGYYGIELTDGTIFKIYNGKEGIISYKAVDEYIEEIQKKTKRTNRGNFCFSRYNKSLTELYHEIINYYHINWGLKKEAEYFAYESQDETHSLQWFFEHRYNYKGKKGTFMFYTHALYVWDKKIYDKVMDKYGKRVNGRFPLPKKFEDMILQNTDYPYLCFELR